MDPASEVGTPGGRKETAAERPRPGKLADGPRTPGPRLRLGEDEEAGPPEAAEERPFEFGRERSRRYTGMSERNRCRFCREKVTRVDYKDVLTLQKLCSAQGRILSRKKSGNCAEHQRQVKRAIKQARYIGLLSYTA
ncbi:MAG: 30S ribosomal protein S18 [Planctomycetota bacterium]